MLKTISLFILVLLVAVFAAISTALIHPNLLRGVISTGAERFAGLELNIGELQSHLNPLRFELKQVSIRNPDWGTEKLLQLNELKLELTELPFAAEPFWDLYGNGITIVVARNEQGELNWISSKLANGETPLPDTRPEQATPTSTILPSDFNFNNIELENVSLTWRNGELEEKIVLPLISAQRVEVGNGTLRLNVEYQEEHFELESRIDLFDPQNGILNYQLALQHSDIQLKTKGRLALNPDLKGSEIDLDLAVQNLSRLAALFETEAPTLPPTTIKATLAFTPDYEIRDLVLKSGDSNINGTITVSQGDFAVNADLDSTLVDIDQLFPASPEADKTDNTENGQEGPIDWQWLDSMDLALKAQIKTLNARGWTIRDLELDTTLKQKITAKISAADISEAQNQHQFNDIVITADLKPLSPTTQGADLNSTFELRQGDIQLSASGPLNVNGIAGTELALTGSAPRSADIWRLAQLPWKEAGPLALDASLASDGDSHSVKGSVNIGEQKARFDLHYLDQTRPRLDGELELSKLDLAFMTEAKPLAAATKTPTAAKTPKTPLFSKEPLPLAALQNMDAKLVISLNDIDTGYNLLKRAKLNPQLDNGTLTLQQSTLQFAHGKASVFAELDSKGNEPSLKATLNISSDNFGKFGLEKAAGIRGGNGRIELEAESKGQSPAELAANLSADLNAKITDLEAKGNALNLIGSDLLTEMISKLNPFDNASETTDIECVAIHFSGKNGKLVSDNGIALETDATKIIGTGSIDLADESLSFGVSPIARKGVGINIGAAAGLVRLAGSLQKPRIVADASGMFSSGLSTGAAIYTGGLSMLAQGLYKRAMYAGSSCDGSLKETPEAEALPDELINPPAGDGPGDLRPYAAE